MRWFETWRADPAVAALADRHYSRKTPGSKQFAPPGRILVLRSWRADAAWVTLWPDPQYVDHDFGDAFTCTLFRNEGTDLSSEMITEAVAATLDRWPEGPQQFLTFVDGRKVASANPGYCFLRAGFERVGRTKYKALHVLRLDGERYPAAAAPRRAQLSLLGEAA